MLQRIIDNNRWNENWWIQLSSDEKLLYQYISDTCDDAGFFEIHLDQMCKMLKFEEKRMRSALNGIRKFFVLSDDKTLLFLQPFLHQQNKLPLRAHNSSHIDIISIIDERLFKFQGNENGLKVITSLLPSSYNKMLGKGNGQSPLRIKHSQSQIRMKVDGFPEEPGSSPAGKRKRKRFIEPSLQDVEDYFQQQISGSEILRDVINYQQVALEFYKHYTGNGWRLKHGSEKKMSDWQAVVRTWCTKRESQLLFQKHQFEAGGQKRNSKSGIIIRSMEQAANTNWNSVIGEVDDQ